jgi:DNA-binding CsgD family transcriptional regulator/plasmid stabilization system protein ParE
VSDVYARAWPLLGLLYAAPGDPKAAARFIEELAKTVSDGACALGIGRSRDEEGGPLLAFNPRDQRLANVPLALPIPGKRGLDQLPVGAVFELAGDPSFAESPLYERLLRPLGAGPGSGLGMVLERAGERVTLLFLLLPAYEGWRPTPQDRALLEALAPHIEQSLRLHERVTAMSASAQALETAFDRLALGVILLDPSARRVSFANRSADEILGISPERRSPERLAAERTAAWARLFVDQQPLRRGSLMLRHPEDGRLLQVFVTRFEWPSSYGAAGARVSTAVFIGDPKRLSGDPVDVMKELYGLTPSEARLALLLTSGCSVRVAARRLGTKLSTTRSVLKNVFSKTGTNRQSDLVRLLLTGPGELRVPEPAAGPARPRPRRRRKT